jgi:hypothetical protein
MFRPLRPAFSGRSVIQERLEEAGIDPGAMDPEEYWRLRNRFKAMADEIGPEAALQAVVKEVAP